MEEFNMADFLRKMPEDFIERRQELLELAKECGCDQDQIQDLDRKSVQQSILTEEAYETHFKFYLFLKVLQTSLNREEICFSGGLNLPMCAIEREK